jgi:uncharacterized protein (DUF39 family)
MGYLRFPDLHRERAGYIDTIVYGTQKSLHNPGYGGGHLFKDLVKGKEIKVEVDTTETVHWKRR